MARAAAARAVDRGQYSTERFKEHSAKYFPKMSKLKKNTKADDNWWPATGLGGKY